MLLLHASFHERKLARGARVGGAQSLQFHVQTLPLQVHLHCVPWLPHSKQYYSMSFAMKELNRKILEKKSRFDLYLDVFTFPCHNYASPSSGEAYRDRQLTPNFELWIEIFCVPTCFHVRIPKPCLSVRPYPEKRNHHS